MSEIKGEDYTVKYDLEAATVNFDGELALTSPQEYKPIRDKLDEMADKKPATITLNLRKLTFLNSSGINMLSKFVIYVRKKEEIELVVLGSNEIAWQSKSLQNLKKLLPTLKLKLEKDAS